MKTTLRISITPLLICISIFSTAQDTTQYYGKMDYIFQYVNKTPITTGILREYGIDFINTGNYAGTALHDSNYVGMDEWRMLYAGLYSAQIVNAGLPTLSAINDQIASYNTGGEPVSFAVLHYNYQQLSSDAVTGNMMTVSNGRLYDVANRTQSPYQAGEVFVIAPIRQAVFTGATELVFRPGLFFSNTGKSVSSIDIDPNGGSNYQAASWNVPFTVSYNTTGFKNVNIRITYTDGTVRYSHTKLAVYESDDAAAQAAGGDIGIARFGDFGGPMILENLPIEATKTYLGEIGVAEITVQLSVTNTTGSIQKPLIIVEGFDPYGDFNFNYLTNTKLSIDENIPNFTPISLNSGLDDLNQYDIIFVNWRNGTDYIQRNAYALEEVIAWVNREKTEWHGTRQQNVLIGMSMGGLVVRYALRDMEINGLNHDTRLFISHDAPHKGANVPAGVQAAVQQFASWKIISFTWGSGLAYTDMIPQAEEAMQIFNSPAAKQMLIQRYILSGDQLLTDNSTYNSFMNEINTMGWPAACKTVLLSNGSCNGTRIFPDNSDMVSITGDKSMTYFGSLWRSFCMSLAGASRASNIAFGNSFNRWAILCQFPLSLFSTSSNIKTEFIVRAAPPVGTIGEIYRGDVYSKKKILGFINVNNYFTKCHVSSTSDMLPLDNAPGGKYNINQYGFDANVLNSNLPDFLSARAFVREPEFCFIPTVSSLAFTNFRQNLTGNVCNFIACEKPALAADFYAPPQNQQHISYTQPSSDWILQQQDANYNCVRLCSNTLSITGPANFCNSATYEVQGLPAGATVTWSAEPAGSVNLVPNGNSVTISGANGSTITLNATINSACDNLSIQKNNISTGTPYVLGAKCNNKVCNQVVLTPVMATGSPVANSYKWELDFMDGRTETVYTSFLHLAIETWENVMEFRLSAYNFCGGSYPASDIVEYTPCPYVPLTFTTSPNPATSSINIEATEAPQEDYEIQLVDLYTGQKVYIKKLMKGSKKTQLLVGHVKRGQYVLVVKDKKGKIVQSKQILLQ